MSRRSRKDRERMPRRSSRKPNPTRLVLGGVVAGVIGLLIFGAASNGFFGGGGGSGEPAPDLVLASAGGQQFRLSDLAGQPRLLYFSFPG